MATLKDIIQKKSLLNPRVLETKIFDYIKSIEEDLVEINADRIRNESKDIFGNPIGFYSYATEVITKGSKKRGEPFDLYDEGVLLNSIFTQNTNSVIRFLNRDPKKSEVFKNTLTNQIFGLTDEELNKVIREKILPFYLNHLREVLDI